MPSPASVFEQRIADKKGELVKAASVVASELLSYTSDDLQKSEKAFENLVDECKESIKFRLYVHLDLDCFFAQCEMDKNPRLKTTPMAVGSDYMLSTANYEARKYGVRSGMPGFQAKQRCPGLVIIQSDFGCYKVASKKFFEVLSIFDSEVVHAGLDEAFIEITDLFLNRTQPDYLNVIIYDGSCKCNKFRIDDVLVECRILSKNDPIQCDYCCLEQIKCYAELFYDVTVEGLVALICDNILLRTNLLVTAGVAYSRMLAKVCSDINKPHGIFVLQHDPKVWENFIHKTPLKKYPGIGPKMTDTLRELGIITGGDLWKNRNKLLAITGGENSTSWGHFARIMAGVDGGALHGYSYDGLANPSGARLISIDGQLTKGHEESFKKCCGKKAINRGYSVIETAIQRTSHESIKKVGALHFKIKFANFEQKTYSYDLKESFALDDSLITFSKKKFDGIMKELGNVEIRLIGIRFGDLDLSETSYIQKSMKKFVPEDEEDDDDEVIEIIHFHRGSAHQPLHKKPKLEETLY